MRCQGWTSQGQNIVFQNGLKMWSAASWQLEINNYFEQYRSIAAWGGRCSHKIGKFSSPKIGLGSFYRHTFHHKYRGRNRQKVVTILFVRRSHPGFSTKRPLGEVFGLGLDFQSPVALGLVWTFSRQLPVSLRPWSGLSVASWPGLGLDFQSPVAL